MSGAARLPPPGRWLAGHFSVCLAAYDARRGNAEGAEADKVLAFYPVTAPPPMQSSLVGLAQAATMFAGTFNKASGAPRGARGGGPDARCGACGRGMRVCRDCCLAPAGRPPHRWLRSPARPLTPGAPHPPPSRECAQECPVHTMETDHNHWAALNAEPGVWLLMVGPPLPAGRCGRRRRPPARGGRRPSPPHTPTLGSALGTRARARAPCHAPHAPTPRPRRRS